MAFHTDFKIILENLISLKIGKRSTSVHTVTKEDAYKLA